jgi:hypothetical protein
VFDSNQTSPSFGVGATPTPSLIRADNVVEAAICKLAVGLTTLTPILPFVCALILGLPLVVEYVLLANKTPPKFILFVVPADKQCLYQLYYLNQ